MATPQSPWTIRSEDLAALLDIAPMPSLSETIAKAEREYIDEGVRRALQLWVSELEPQLMFRVGDRMPFALTAKGHDTPYINIKWDSNFYLTGEPRRYYIGATFR